MKKHILMFSMIVSVLSACSSDPVGGNTACPDGCLIEDTCYPESVTNPINICQICDPDTSAIIWTAKNNGSCNDGLFCTENDTCSDGQCTGQNRQVDDGIACNGTESCDEEQNIIVSTGNQCSGDDVCDMQSGRCLGACTGCLIDNVCYGNLQRNPTQQCQICNVDETATDWINANGSACNDGLFCTEHDTCMKGVCSGTDVVADDGLYCNGVETCFEDSKQFETTGYQCSTEEVCSAFSGNCVPLCSGCTIDDICYVDQQINPDNPCELCEISISRTAWTAGSGSINNEECICNPGYEGTACIKKSCIVHVKTDGNDEDDGYTWDTAKQSIQIAIAQAFENKCDVWVKAGTYNEQLYLKNQVQVYGSFAGTETLFSQRVLKFEEVNGKQIPVPSSTINGDGQGITIECTLSFGCGNAAILNGFVVTGGYHEGNGGGMYNRESGPLIQNVVFENNIADAGGAVFNEFANPRFETCYFTENTTFNGVNGVTSGTLCSYGGSGTNGGNGGAVYSLLSNLTFTNCLISNNQTGYGGAGARSQNCNTSAGRTGGKGGNGGDGGALYSTYSSINLINSSFVGNITGYGGNAGHIGSGTTIDGSWTGWTGATGGYGGNGGSIYSDHDEYHVVNCAFMNNQTGDGGRGGNGGTLANGGRGGRGGSAGNGAALYVINAENQLDDLLLIKNKTGDGGQGGNGGSGFTGTNGSPGAGGSGGNGAGIYCYTAESFMTNNTNADNVLGAGGPGGTWPSTGATGSAGVGSWFYATNESIISLSNSILWTGDLYLSADSNTDIAYSTIEISPILSDNGNNADDPFFMNPTLSDYRLKDMSPLIDSGNTDLLSLDTFDLDQDGNISELLPYDLQGNTRIRDMGLDRGAYEKVFKAPDVESLMVLSPTEIQVSFDEEVQQASTETLSNYTIDNGINVTNAVLDVNLRIVSLTVDNLDAYNDYVLTINNVLDLSGNQIADDTMTPFSVSDLRPYIINAYFDPDDYIYIQFSEEVLETDVETISNYSITALTIDGASWNMAEPDKAVLVTSESAQKDTDYALIADNIIGISGWSMDASSFTLRLYSETSCLEVLNAELSHGDDWYTLTIQDETRRVFCDMTTEGGGYTFYPIDAGIRTYRSTDNDSCKDIGMQIAVPRSRNHWQSMLMYFGNSYFTVIPGISKDFNGGNYSGCIMRSYGDDHCEDWAALDGGAWWLRDTTYSEPNGDYTANCWLNAATITNVDDIRFNDANCAYSTVTYLCSTNDK